jgi:hypothetical protein
MKSRRLNVISYPLALVVAIAAATPTMGHFHCVDVCESVLCETLRTSNYFSQTTSECRRGL